MGKLNIFTLRLASLLVFHAAGAGLASPAVLVTRPVSRVAVEWLPIDNQTIYRLGKGESRSLELNTTSISQSVVFFSISQCSRDFHWALYHGKSTSSSGHLMLRKEHNSSEDLSTFSLNISQQDKYVLVLSSSQGGAAVVSVRGEATRQVRMRLRVRSRRRLAANWEPSPIDPQATTYCVVASHLKNYTSLCAAQHELKLKRMENKSNKLSQESDRLKERINDTFPQFSLEVDNKINVDEGTFNIFEGKMNNVFRRKKFGRSTKVTDEDPVIACVGSRTHHLIENLDPSVTYFVSVFGIANDRRSGSLLASGSVRPRTSTAKRLRENLPSKVDIRGRNVFYFKATVGSGGGLWLTVSSCGGAVDVEVLVRGKRLHMVRNIDPHAKFFVSTPIPTSSVQETSDEGSIQFDSSSEEARVRYVIKVMPSRRDRDNSVAIELTASTTRWGVSAPELSEDGSTVRELRPRRSCKSVDVAFIPATHNATDVIRYCIIAREIVNGGSYSCWLAKKSTLKGQCIDNVTKSARVIMHKIVGLKPGRKYAVQVVAVNKGNSVPYNILYVDTNASCKEDK